MGLRISLIVCCAAIAGVAFGKPSGLGEQLPRDALGAARLARTEGDAALLRVLKAESPARVDMLAALRAAPHAAAPEQLVPPLCEVAASRDPHLAPAAGLALFQLAEGLDPRDIAAREVSRGSLRAARKALESLAAHEPAPRADLVFAARFAEAAFAQVEGQLGGAAAK